MSVNYDKIFIVIKELVIKFRNIQIIKLKIGDILNYKFMETLHKYQEVALGGGNVLEHPDLIPFLEKLKEKGVDISNNIYTVEDAVSEILNIAKGGTLND